MGCGRCEYRAESEEAAIAGGIGAASSFSGASRTSTWRVGSRPRSLSHGVPGVPRLRGRPVGPTLAQRLSYNSAAGSASPLVATTCSATWVARPYPTLLLPPDCCACFYGHGQDDMRLVLNLLALFEAGLLYGALSRHSFAGCVCACGDLGRNCAWQRGRWRPVVPHLACSLTPLRVCTMGVRRI